MPWSPLSVVADKFDLPLPAAIDWAMLEATALLAILFFGLRAAARAIARRVGARRRATNSSWLRPLTHGSRGIFVLTHGLDKTVDHLAPLASFVANLSDYEDHAVYLHDYSASKYSNAAPGTLAVELQGELEDILEQRLESQADFEVILVGHSLGGLIMRRAYLNEVRRHDNNPDNPSYASSWAARVTRIVLLAAPNRGSSIARASRWFRWTKYYPARWARIGELPLAILRGAPFIVNLRLEWIGVFRDLHSVPAVAQFIGSRDTQVGAQDSEDVLSLPNALKTEPFADLDHHSILSAPACHIRVRHFLAHSALRAPSRGERQALLQASESVAKVLVMHGIRDYGERFQDSIKRALAQACKDAGIRAMVRAPRYAYFSALDFLLPWVRELRVHKFVDEYAELLAEVPHGAPIHFVGHSFGTYQIADSLRQYGQVQFGRVFLAGSVLREDFEWRSFMDSATPRVTALCNTAAYYDWPVGILCAGIRLLKLSDLIGTGGYNGFTLDGPNVTQIRYYGSRRGHGAAIEGEGNLATITDWVLNRTEGRTPFQPEPTLERLRASGAIGKRPPIFARLHQLAPPAIAALVAFGLLGPLVFTAVSSWVAAGTLAVLAIVMRYV